MVQENEPWQLLLRDALAVLALPADEQVRVNGPGCVSCDLIEDFRQARHAAESASAVFSEEQQALLSQLEEVIESMQDPDFECFNTGAICRPVWQRLRELAVEALRAFGWAGVEVRPFEEIQPDVWHRPLS